MRRRRVRHDGEDRCQIRRDFGGISAGDNKEIQEVARLLLDGIMGENARKYPRLIVKLLQGMGFCLFRTIFKTPAQTGLLAVDPSLEELDPRYERGRVIFVDSRTSTAHQRFVIATLLGHYIFDFDEANEITYYEMYQGKEAGEAGMRANLTILPNDGIPFQHTARQYDRIHTDFYTRVDIGICRVNDCHTVFHMFTVHALPHDSCRFCQLHA